MLVDWRCAVIFLSALCLTTFATGLGARYELRPATAADVTQKIAALAAYPEPVDTVAIGSSRMLHEFDPVAVAAAPEQAGCQVHAYNLGVGGLNGIEMQLLLRKLDELHPRGVRRIVFDMPNHIYVQFDNLRSRRVFVTTDPWEAPLAVADILSHPDPRKLSALLRYAAAFLYHNSAIGALAPFLQPALAAPTPVSDAVGDGFAPLDEATDPQSPEHQHLRAKYQSFADLIGQLHRASLQSATLPPDNGWTQLRARLADRQIDLIASFGYEPVLLLLPDTYPQAITDAAMLEAHVHVSHPGVAVISLMAAPYADTVYDPRSWWDWTHLSDATVKRLSPSIGRDLCQGSTNRTPTISAIQHALH